ncbi:alpha/beta fold hydrolase [Aeromicrobium sp.]
MDAALDAWTGDLLPDDPYAPWAFQPRQRAELVHRELLRRAGRWGELVTVDPTDEEAHLGVAQSLLAVGNRAGALRQIDVLEKILRDELGIGLSPEAYDLRIQALDTPVSVPTATQPPAPRHAGLARQRVRFCNTSDGARLAYATSGKGPPLETVVDTLGLERFPLLGMSQGGPIALTYAARHPERVSHLVVTPTASGAPSDTSTPGMPRAALTCRP